MEVSDKEMEVSEVEKNERTVLVRNRTKLEIILIFIVILLCIGLIITLTALVIAIFRINTTKICLTEVCVKAANEILSTIDQSVSPCDDFYRFSCGKWIKNAQIPEETGYTNIFLESNQKLDYILKDLIETANNSMPAYALVKNYYNSCINTSTTEKNGIKLLRQTLHSLGDWPVINGSNWDNTTFNWIEVMSKLRDMGLNVNHLFKLEVGPNPVNNTQYVIKLSEPELGLRSQILTQSLNNSIITTYHKLMVDSALMLGANDSDINRIEHEMWSIIEFERDLAQVKYNISSDEEIMTGMIGLNFLINLLMDPNVEFNETGVSDELLKEQPKLGKDWIKLLETILKTNYTISENETIFVENLSYLINIDLIVSSLDRNDRRLLANYILWRIVFQSLGDGNSQMRELTNNLNKQLYGVTTKKPRWKECLSEIPFGRALSSLYMKKYFDKETKAKATEMIDFIHKEFDEILSDADWMDTNTKLNASKKSKMIKFIVGYPDQILNDTLINESYKDLILSNDNYLENMRLTTKWAKNIEFGNLRKKNDKYSWRKFTSTTDVNAYFLQDSNAAFIPAAILRDVFYDPKRPHYLNYGAIGFIVGHEITHAFDNTGALFDGEGNHRDWWLNSTKLEYQKKVKCMIKQYNQIQLSSGHKINGNYTLGENIADNGAVRVVFNAYNNYVKKYGQELRLPALEYTPQQLFWISVAKTWCSKHSNEAFNATLDNDVHSPSELRVNIPLSNYEEFGQIFNCKLGSKMRPKNKCKIW